jgi:outer membrane protein OmpA-like peptidoglycan-associated protein
LSSDNDLQSKADQAADKPEIDSGSKADDQLEALRQLILGSEMERLSQLEQRLDDPEQQARFISGILPAAVGISIVKDKALSEALTPTIEGIISNSIRRDINRFADAIFPVMGPAIRKSITETFKEMIQSLNTTLDRSISWQGIKWRLEAARTGKSFAEIVILHGLVYRVEQVFLIHKVSGTLLQHGTSSEIDSFEDADLVSAMLTAIRDFVRDSFNENSSQTLDALQMGELNLWIEQGPDAIIACAIRGNAPESFRVTMRNRLEKVHRDASILLNDYQGDADPFSAIYHHVEACLEAKYVEKEKKISPLFYVGVVVLIFLTGGWIYNSHVEKSRLQTYLQLLSSEPGIILTGVNEMDQGYIISGLRDPLSKDPTLFITESGLAQSKVELHMELYASMDERFILGRAEKILNVSDAVKLTLNDGKLSARGVAGNTWINNAEKLVTVIAGIHSYDDSQLGNADLLQLGAPDSVVMKIEDRTLYFSGAASHKWIQSIGLRALLIDDIDHVDLKQLEDRDKAKLQGLTNQLETMIIGFQLKSHEDYDFSETKQISTVALINELTSTASLLGYDSRIRLIGRSDATGRKNKNEILSVERAITVRNVLTSHGSPAKLFSVVGLGNRKPLTIDADNQDATSIHKINRSVSFQVILEPVAGSFKTPSADSNNGGREF